MTVSPVKTVIHPWPVVEIIGPTIQGEGVDQGVVAHFVRFGGCDYSCTWCDTPYSVIASEVRKNSVKMSASDILENLDGRPWAPWIILTGGNPALHDLQPLVDKLHEHEYLVAVETQGSRWLKWMRDVDRLCVSPKPPSALEVKSTLEGLKTFMDKACPKLEPLNDWMFLKIVIFETVDLEYAIKVRKAYPNVSLYLSIGNDAGRTVSQPTREDSRLPGEVREDLLEGLRWLADEVRETPELCTNGVFIQAQLHTLMWGNGRGF